MPCLLLALLALPAQAQTELLYNQWKNLRDPGAPYVTFDEASGFLNNHPGWPQEKMIQLRAEQAALFEQPDPASLKRYCASYPPISGRGMVACARAGAGTPEERASWIKQAWKQGDFNADEEDSLLAVNKFTAEEHQARVDRLLVEGKTSQAARMLPRLTPAYRLLSEARIALITDARNAQAKLFNVPSHLKNDPGLMLNRLQWRSRHGQEDGVREILLAAPANPPYADAWWPYRASAVRDLVEDGRYSQAISLLRKAGTLNAENGADALFLKGWIAMEFKGDARTGYKDFYKLYGAVSTPVSKARAAYWAGRAAKKNGNAQIAHDWFTKGAAFSTVFYGQLAAAELNPGAPLDLPASPAASSDFGGRILPQTAMWLEAQGDVPMANLFLTHATDTAPDASYVASLAQLAIKNGFVHGGVKVAKQALRRNIVLVEAGWPTARVPAQSPIEPALALAIARQESEFNAKARSSADARGLMQVLPGTANHTAKRHGLNANAKDLYDPQANMLIGTTYLGALIDGWDGSYILAIASYNAGPANIRKWITRFGPPPKDVAGAVNWIEKIPYAETRNYVMRVTENLQVYRTRLNEQTPLGITGDLVR